MLDHTISMEYMLGGYGAFTVLFVAYLVSLIVRWRNTKRSLHSLDDIRKNQ